MTQKAKQRLIGVLVVVLILGGGAIYAMAPRTVKVKGTLVSVDPAARTATLRYVEKKTGQTKEIVGRAAPDCQVTLDGRSVPLTDLRPGDEVEVRGKHTLLAGAAAQSVQAHRPAGGPTSAASAPAEH